MEFKLTMLADKDLFDEEEESGRPRFPLAARWTRQKMTSAKLWDFLLIHEDFIYGSPQKERPVVSFGGVGKCSRRFNNALNGHSFVFLGLGAAYTN